MFSPLMPLIAGYHSHTISDTVNEKLFLINRVPLSGHD